MSLPEFNENGDLPDGVHVATFGGEQAMIEFWQTKRDDTLRGIIEIREAS